MVKLFLQSLFFFFINKKKVHNKEKTETTFPCSGWKKRKGHTTSSCSDTLRMNPSQRSLADTKPRHLGETRKKDEADYEQAEIQKRAYDDYKTSILKACLEPGAFERLRRVALVKPEKANAAEACLLNMCQRTGPTTKIDESTVISILEKVNAPSEMSKTSGSIKFCRKRNYDSDDDI